MGTSGNSWVWNDMSLLAKMSSCLIHWLYLPIAWEHTLAIWESTPDEGSWWLLLEISGRIHWQWDLLLVNPAVSMSSCLLRQVIRRDSSSAGAYENGQAPEWGGKDAVHAIDKLLPRSNCQLASAGTWDLPSILEAAPTEAMRTICGLETKNKRFGHSTWRAFHLLPPTGVLLLPLFISMLWASAYCLGHASQHFNCMPFWVSNSGRIHVEFI